MSFTQNLHRAAEMLYKYELHIWRGRVPRSCIRSFRAIHCPPPAPNPQAQEGSSVVTWLEFLYTVRGAASLTFSAFCGENLNTAMPNVEMAEMQADSAGHVKDIVSLIEEFHGVQEVTADGAHMTVAQAAAVGRRPEVRVVLDGRCKAAVDECSRWVQQKAREGADIYGVTTGFGACSSKRTHQTTPLQDSLIRCMLAGVFSSGEGGQLSVPATRCAMLLRANSFLRGASGIRWEVVEALRQLLNSQITPRCPLRGSVTASGDLIPLAYIAGLLLGKPPVKARTATGGEVSAAEGLRRAGVTPVKLQAKEGLALVNGTSFAAALASLVLYDANVLLLLAEALGAMFFEVMLGREECAHPFIHETKPHPGQVESASLLRWLLGDSPFMRISRKYYSVHPLKKPRQDRYALRSAPQWLGPQVQIIRDATAVVQIEINSANDNPLIDPLNGRALHGANFQGSAVGFYMDYVRVAAAGLGKLLFAQFTELMIEFYNNGLPGNLSPTHDLSLDYAFKGVDIAMAAYCSELQFLANPVTTHVHSAEQHNQDINSLALISARKTEEALEILKLMIASYLCALCQAVDLRELEQLLGKVVVEAISAASDACQLPDSVKGELLNAAKPIPVYSYIEGPCDPSLPLLSKLRQTCLECHLFGQNCTDSFLHKIPQFESLLRAQLEPQMTATRLSYERGQHHLSQSSIVRSSKLFPLYAFVRKELNTRIMSATTEQTPEDDIQKIFDSIMDGRISAPLLHCLRGFVH